MRALLISISLVLCALSLPAQPTASLKQQAGEAFRAEHYPEAIKLLERAAKADPRDAEIYYLLGFYTHYNAYDSRPLSGYDVSYSARVFAYLDKALEIRPDYGDAKYFYGAECSANAFLCMQRGDAAGLRTFYKKAFDKGAYPEWLLELGRNRLEQCGRDAILFAGGNPDFDVSMYLQLHEGLRTDITVMPVGYIDRPWYVEFIKKGLAGAVRSIRIGLDDWQIYDIHPFKWDTTAVSIPVPAAMAAKYGATGRSMEWIVEPDLTSGRMKQENRAARRTFLSPQRAILLHIVEANRWERPVYFSNGTVTELMGGLDAYLRDCGLVGELLPVKTGGTKWEVDPTGLEALISPPRLSAYPQIAQSDIPRISGTTTFYHAAALALAGHYAAVGNAGGVARIEGIYRKYLLTGLFPQTETSILAQIEKLRK